MAVLALALLFGALATLANGNLIPPVIAYIQNGVNNKYIDKPGHPLLSTTPVPYVLSRIPNTNLYNIKLATGNQEDLVAQLTNTNNDYVSILFQTAAVEARFQYIDNTDYTRFYIYNPSSDSTHHYLGAVNGDYLVYSNLVDLWRFNSAWTTIAKYDTYTPPAPMTFFTATAMIRVLPGYPQGGVGRIFDKITVGGNNGWLLDLYPGLTLRAIVSPGLTVTSSSTIGAYNDYHVALTYDGSRAKIYINGVLVGASPYSSSPMTQNNLPITVGKDSAGGTTFPGFIQRAQIFPIVLTQDQVLHDYQNWCDISPC